MRQIIESGKTPAGMHLPIMVSEILAHTRPRPGDVVIDCTLGGGGHARALLERILPGGRLIGIDVDSLQLPRTVEALRGEGYGPDAFVAHETNFAGLARVLTAEGVVGADILIADLGVSSMQLDNPQRGFSYKGVGPLDMRMNPARGQPASEVLRRIDEGALVRALEEHADEPHAAIIAALLKEQTPDTTHGAERTIRVGLTHAHPQLSKADVKMSIRRTFQALRILVNDEFAVLDALLRSLPHLLAPGGRAAMLTFHSGEDRRVKKAFQAGHRAGIYTSIATDVTRSSMAETRANRRASSAKLRWAIKAVER